MLPINTTGEIWGLMQNATVTTGSLFMTLLLTVLFFVCIAFMFRMPIWSTAIFVLPIMIVFLSFYSDFLSVVGVTLIYLALIFVDAFILR
jgi:hypothetical protein